MHDFNSLKQLERDTLVIVYYLDRLKESGIIAEGRFSLTKEGIPVVEKAIQDGYKVPDSSIITFCINPHAAHDEETAIGMAQLLKDCRDNGVDETVKECNRLLTEYEQRNTEHN